jgi:AraC-like DNA-binding protein
MPDVMPLHLQAQQQELATLIAGLAPDEGQHATCIRPLTLYRLHAPSEPIHGVAQPSLCIIAQGAKEIVLAGERYRYDPLHYIVASVALPVSGQVIEASPQAPYLSLRLDIEPAMIAQLIAETDAVAAPASPARGLSIERLDAPLLDAVLRLVRLLKSPRDVGVLAPLVMREIFYRLLGGPQGGLLRDIALGDSQSHRVNRAIDWLNQNFGEPLRIETLARQVNLSVSTLHHRFKAVTAMSPLQYQKYLRLQEARRLMLNEGLEAAAAAFRVGYESPSQFSREYRRQFGAPPVRDLSRLRNSA